MTSYLGVWNKFWTGRSSDEKDLITKLSSDFINRDNDIKVLEDWGCGKCILAKYLRPDIKYIGIDCSNIETDYNTKIEVLNKYKSEVDCVYMKHVLEHNHDWDILLRNMLSSFTKKAVLVLFISFTDNENDKQLNVSYKGTNVAGQTVEIPDLSISKIKFDAILSEYPNITYKSDTMKWTSQYGHETVYYFSK